MKVPLLSVHPAAPVRVQVPLIKPSVRGGAPFTSVPVTLPAKVSVFPDAFTVYLKVPLVCPVLGLTEFKTIVPCSFWPSTGKQPVVFKNWK